MKSKYDAGSAITFLLLGMGIGSALTIVLKPKRRIVIDRIRNRGGTGNTVPHARIKLHRFNRLFVALGKSPRVAPRGLLQL
jgi:hypothetical protein